MEKIDNLDNNNQNSDNKNSITLFSNNLNITSNIKSKGNFRNFSYSNKDTYYRKAKEEGFRARSVYKLREIEHNFNLIQNAKNILDLCAAPGSWSQMLRSFSDSKTKICSVDLQAIVPIEGVHTIQGDITKQSTIKQILSYFEGEKLDLIVFDGAPDVTGILEVDINMQTQLITCSLIICMKLLHLGGKFVAKVFKSNEHDFYYDKAKSIFKYVTFYKPSSSRLTSHETFLVAEGMYIDDNLRKEIEKITLEEIFELHEKNFFINDFEFKEDDNNIIIKEDKSNIEKHLKIDTYSPELLFLLANLFEVFNI